VRKLLLILTVTSAPLWGCSLVLNWDPAGLQCDSNPTNSTHCSTGYSCLVDKCVADSSLGEDETCLLDQQCASPLFCAPQLHTCHKACTSYYAATSAQECAVSEYCKPVRVEPNSSWKGACVKSDCQTATDCRANQSPLNGDACVQVTERANACFNKCAVSCTGSSCADTGCALLSDKYKVPYYCQPMGKLSSEQLVCMPGASLPGQGSVGNSCEPVTNPCADGNACNQECHPYCNWSAPACPLAMATCCPCTGATVDGTVINYDLCFDTTSSPCPKC